MKLSITTFFVALAVLLCSVRAQQKRVLGVYFVESNRSFRRREFDAILTQLRLVQREYLRNFGGTFELADPPVRTIRGDHTSSWYVDTVPAPFEGNAPSNNPRWYRLDNMRAEIVRKLRLDGNTRIINYPTTTVNGRVGAYVSTNRVKGAYMDYDDLLCVLGEAVSKPFDGGREAEAVSFEQFKYFELPLLTRQIGSNTQNMFLILYNRNVLGMRCSRTP